MSKHSSLWPGKCSKPRPSERRPVSGHLQVLTLLSGCPQQAALCPPRQSVRRVAAPWGWDFLRDRGGEEAEARIPQACLPFPSLQDSGHLNFQSPSNSAQCQWQDCLLLPIKASWAWRPPAQHQACLLSTVTASPTWGWHPVSSSSNQRLSPDASWTLLPAYPPLPLCI